MDFLKILDDVLLSYKVEERFNSLLENNLDFKLWLDSVIPEIRACESQKQNNPWHKYNVLNHILHSVDAMNKQTKGMPESERRILAYTMLMHDIGKPAKHIIREKNGEMIDSFFDHNVESEVVARRVLPKLNFSEDEINIIAKLVYKHDIFMFIKDKPTKNPHWKVLTPELIEEEIKELSEVGDGAKLMKWLVMVGRSDNLAQNEKMTGEALALLEKINKILARRTTELKRRNAILVGV